MAVESTTKVHSQRGFGQSPWVLALLVFAGTSAAACKQKPAAEDTTSAGQSGEVVLLRGSFQAVAKPAKGTAEIIRKGEQYTLKLTQVSVESTGPVHVYLVGLPSAPNTIVVDEVDMKYDMAPLTPAVPEQLVDLPSEPDSALRSVVLWDPRYGANLASASLSAVK